MARGQQTTDFTQIAERFEARMNFDKINSKEDYEDQIKKIVGNDPKARNILPYIDDVFDAGDFKDKLDDKIKNQKEIEEQVTASALAEAQRYERSRERRSRLRDESRNARTIRPATKRNVRGWIRGKGKRTDIKGIDTRLSKNLATRNMITRRDIGLPKNIKVTINSLGFKQYRSGNGQFLSAKKIRELQKRKKKR